MDSGLKPAPGPRPGLATWIAPDYVRRRAGRTVSLRTSVATEPSCGCRDKWEKQTLVAQPNAGRFGAGSSFRYWPAGLIRFDLGPNNATRREAGGWSGCWCQRQSRVAPPGQPAVR